VRRRRRQIPDGKRDDAVGRRGGAGRENERRGVRRAVGRVERPGHAVLFPPGAAARRVVSGVALRAGAVQAGRARFRTRPADGRVDGQHAEVAGRSSAVAGPRPRAQARCRPGPERLTERRRAGGHHELSVEVLLGWNGATVGVDARSPRSRTSLHHGSARYVEAHDRHCSMQPWLHACTAVPRST